MAYMASRHPELYRQMIERLRQARIEAKLTQEAVAELLGVRQTLVSKMETGERRVDPIELQELADLYEKDVTDFIPARRGE